MKTSKLLITAMIITTMVILSKTNVLASSSRSSTLDKVYKEENLKPISATIKGEITKKAKVKVGNKFVIKDIPVEGVKIDIFKSVKNDKIEKWILEKTTKTDKNGKYSVDVSAKVQYKVLPTKDGLSFDPSFKLVKTNVKEIVKVDFKATDKHNSTVNDK